MNPQNQLVFVAALLFAAVGCNRPESKDLPRSASSAAATTPRPAPALPKEEPTVAPVTTGEPTTRVAPGEIPTPEDFEEEAEEKLAAANLEVELDALEREIGQ